MQTYLRSSGIQPGAGNRNHHELIGELRAARKEMQAYGAMMTAYEKEVIKEDIAERKENYRTPIINGLLADWEAAIETVKLAQGGIQRAYENEARRWDSGKLAQELTAARHLAELAIQRGKTSLYGESDTKTLLQGLITDAQNSGDEHKLRAVCEVVAGLRDAGVMAGRAAAMLREIRQAPDLVAAQQAEFEAVRVLAEVRKEMAEAGDLIGEPVDDPLFAVGKLAQATRRVKVDNTGVVIRDADDPEVTRVYGRGPEPRERPGGGSLQDNQE